MSRRVIFENGLPEEGFTAVKQVAGKEVALMFSGGVDSTFAALRLSERFEKVSLLTYSNEYAHYHLKRARRRFYELRKIAGDKFSHEIISIKDIFDEVVLRELDDDYKTYSSGFIWCMGCKIVMHARTIMYNLEKGISCSCDGASLATAEMVEQMPASLREIKDFYAYNKIDYSLPVYNVPREEEIAELKKKGFFMGIRILDRHLGIQPRCIPGEIYYLPYILFKQPLRHAETDVRAYIRAKREKLQPMIDEISKKTKKGAGKQ